MTLNDIEAARIKFSADHQKLPTKLNIVEPDAAKLLVEMVGRAVLPRELHARASEIIGNRVKIKQFFEDAELMGMQITIVPVVE